MSALVRIPRQSKAPFLDGMARLIDVGGRLRRHKRFDSGFEADVYALQRDWDAIQRDWDRVRQDVYIATVEFVAEMEGVKASRAES